MPLTTKPVPQRLEHLVATRGHDPQPPARWSHRSWQAALPSHQDFLKQLPDRLGRDDVEKIARSCSDDTDVIRVFIAAMVWGYGPVGYGPYRTARVLAENPDLQDKLGEAATRVRTEGGPAAFAWLAKNRIKRLGVAFATKYLFYFTTPNQQPALVLDSRVHHWLREYGALRVGLDWHVADYERYIQTTVAWAQALSTSPGQVEYLMFSDTGTNDRGNLDRGPDDAATLMEEYAVLDALDDAADAFLALPGPLPLDDSDDFERGIRQLRRIVLARAARHGMTA